MLIRVLGWSLVDVLFLPGLPGFLLMVGAVALAARLSTPGEAARKENRWR